MKILIAGDLVPTKSNESLFIDSDLDRLLGKELLELWNTASYKIVNIEAPYAENEKPIDKNGPNLVVDPKCINGIKKLNIDLVCLANNHILDYGIGGLESTISLLKKEAINYVGTYSKTDSKKSHNIGEKIAVYACCENEFSVDYNLDMCANGWEEARCLEEIKELKEKNEKVIVLFHGGKEHYRYPSPNLQKTCRMMIDSGADIVICQHTHCIGCKEEYAQGIIVYGQGNFIFDSNDNEYWQTSLLIQLDVSDTINIKYIPIKKEGNVIRLATKEESKDILNSFEQRSIEILNKDLVEKKYEEYADMHIDNYLFSLHGSNIVFRCVNRLFGHKLTRKLYSKKDLLKIKNCIECESHRELMLKGIDNIIKNNKEGDY